MNERTYVKIIVGGIFSAVIVVYGLILFLPESRYMDGEYPYWMEQRSHVMSDNDKREILLLGDSRTKMDLLAYELSDDTYNLSLGGGTPIEMYYTVKNYINHHPNPKAIFIAFGPMHYQESECYLSRNEYFHYFDNDTIDDVNRVIRENGGKDFSNESFAYKNRLPSVYFKQVVKSILKPRTQENQIIYNKAKENKGQMFGANKSVTEVMAPETKYDQFISASYLDYYMRKLIELCIEKDIPIYIEQAPMGNPGYKELVDKGYIDDYQKYMDELESSYNISINRNIPIYPENDFQDGSHLNEDGARKFTQKFKEKYISVFQ